MLDGVEVRELGVPKYRGKSRLAYVGSYLRFLLVRLAGVPAAAGQAASSTSFTSTTFRTSWCSPACCRGLRGSKVVLDVHDSVPETFATKFSGSSDAQAGALPRRAGERARGAQGDLRQPSAARRAGRARDSRRQDVHLDERAGSRGSSSAPADRSRPPARRRHFNLVYHGTMAERLGVDLIIRAVARLQDRIPGVRLHLWGHGDDLAGVPAAGPRPAASRTGSCSGPKGFRCRSCPGASRAMDLGVVGNRRSVAGDLMLPVKLHGVRLARAFRPSCRG